MICIPVWDCWEYQRRAHTLTVRRYCLLPALQVISRWEEYMSKVRPKQGREVEVQCVAAHFPFHKYFSNAPQPVFKGRSYEEDMDIAEGCFRHIKKIFTQLEVRMSHAQPHARTHTVHAQCTHSARVPSVLSNTQWDIRRLHQCSKAKLFYL